MRCKPGLQSKFSEQVETRCESRGPAYQKRRRRHATTSILLKNDFYSGCSSEETTRLEELCEVIQSRSSFSRGMSNRVDASLCEIGFPLPQKVAMLSSLHFTERRWEQGTLPVTSQLPYLGFY